MGKEMIISSSGHETMVAILEDDQVAEVFVERERRSRGPKARRQTTPAQRPGASPGRIPTFPSIIRAQKNTPVSRETGVS